MNLFVRRVKLCNTIYKCRYLDTTRETYKRSTLIFDNDWHSYLDGRLMSRLMTSKLYGSFRSRGVRRNENF